MKKVFQEIWNQLKPPRAFSWQTLILLSVFSWALSFLSETQIVQEILSWLGWLFLTIGVGWALSGVKLNLLGWKVQPGPWVTGAIACTLLFWREGSDPFPLALTLWPIVSAAIAIVPRFFPRLTFTLPDPATRQELLILLLVSLLMSSWLRFHFLVQAWLTDYPSLLTDDLSRSGFVVSIAHDLPADPRGAVLINKLSLGVNQALDGRPWSQVERWLIDRDERIQDILAQGQENLPSVPEDDLWTIQGIIPPQQTRSTEYPLVLRATWQGPSSRPGGYYLEKTCWVRQSSNPAALQQGTNSQITGIEPIARVECQPEVGDKMWMVPETVSAGGVG